jgi:hypothetical protein
MAEQLNDALPSDSPFVFEYVGTKTADIDALNTSSKKSGADDATILYGFKLVRHYDGYYINGDGVNVRTRPRINATSIGMLYTNDVVWYDPYESWTYADGYEWIHVWTDSLSNMGEREGYMVTDFLGDPW